MRNLHFQNHIKNVLSLKNYQKKVKKKRKEKYKKKIRNSKTFSGGKEKGLLKKSTF